MKPEAPKHRGILKPVLTCILFTLLLGTSTSVLAWGSLGHQLIAELAEPLLTAETRSAVKELLGSTSLAEASVWADEMRARPDHPQFWGYNYSANWHFINIASSQNYANSDKSPRGDAYTALLACIAILQNREPEAGPVPTGLRLYLGNNLHTRKAKILALKFLLHLTGDLHQPLHVGYAQDRGGNEVKLKWSGKTTNLHAVWDSQLFPANMRKHTAALLDKLAALDKNERSRLAGNSPLQWIEEDQLLLEKIYTAASPVSDEAEYRRTFQPVVDEQVLKAALRTAQVLNQLFSNPE